MRAIQVVVFASILCSIESSCVSASEDAIIWSRRYRGDTTASEVSNPVFGSPVALHVDDDGFVIVGGSARGSGQNNIDITILKYDSAGGMVWARQWDGSTGGGDRMYDMVVDESGDIYATGSTIDREDISDCITLKYGPDGELKWKRQYDGDSHGTDRGKAIAVSTTGDVFVAGSSNLGEGKMSDWLTLKYDNSGRLKWQQTHGGAFDDDALLLSVVGGGGLYVGGIVNDKLTLSDGSVRKCNSEGVSMWTRGFSSPGAQRDKPVSLLVTEEHGVILVGRAFPYEKRTDAAININAWDSSGRFLWVRNQGGEGTLDDVPAASFVDDSGSIYITALTESHPDSFDVLTMKLAPDGQPIWKRVYASAGGGYDSPRDMKLDSQGNVHVLAQSSNNTALLTYSPNGELLAEIVHNFGEETSTSENPVALAVDPHGYRYVLVQNRGDIVVVKFRPL